MREIKFRAWDKVMKVYREVLSIDLEKQKVICPPRGHEFTEWYNQHLSFNEVLLLQYTGLKDRNGKEIYEGDFVNVPIHNWQGQVVFTGDCYYALEGKSSSGNKAYLSFFEIYLNECEIIGNIYENPELLEGEGA